MTKAIAASAVPSLVPGARLGPYLIEVAIGAGGMGEVYRASDTRLGRTVALKVLPHRFAADPDRRHRFEREARAVSALDHPHICALHDIGSEAGVDYLVLEHLKGQTLATRLQRGRLRRHEALRFATEIAEALDAAHRRGIVHRDLKPGNVMLTQSGVKVLDFGLARLTTPGAGTMESTSTTLTDAGTVLGTAPYMSPEQVEGREADARSDIWSLGVVLYEMLTGRRAFEAESAASVMAAILRQEPPLLSSQDPLAPPALEHLVRRCLAKDPEARWQSARDLADELAWIAEADTRQPARSAGPWTRRRVAVLAVAGVALLLAGTVAGVWSRRSPAAGRGPVIRTLLSVEPADAVGGQSFLGQGIGGTRTSLALSPDGRVLVFVGRQGELRGGTRRLYVRRLEEPRATAIPGTEEAEGPFFSPGGEWVGFWARGHLWKVALPEGPPVSICSLPSAPHGASWGVRGRIVLGQETGGLLQVPETGGEATPLTAPGPGEHSHRLPHLLPGGDAVVFTVTKGPYVWTQLRVVAQSLRSGTRKVLFEGGTDARYVPSGHLVFLRLGTLMAVPFDAARLEVKGAVVGLMEGIAQAAFLDNEDWDSGAGQFSVSSTGALAFIQGATPALPRLSLARADRRGVVTALPAPERNYFHVSLAPDGRRAAVYVRQESGFVLWQVDLERGTLTLLEPGWYPRWAPNGRDLAFARAGEGLFRRPAEGPGPAMLLLTDPGYAAPASWTPDGSRLAFVRRAPTPGGGFHRDILWLEASGPQPAAEPLLATPFDESEPEFSPDGRWLAYQSDESGRMEVYVQAHPAGTPRVQVSKEGGFSPAWARSRRELFYVAWPRPDPKLSALMAVAVATTPRLSVGLPQVLFEFDNSRLGMGCTETRCYDVAPDGQSFLAPYSPGPPATPVVTQVNLILNWAEELKARAPAGR